MSPDSRESQRVSSKLFGKDGVVISELKSNLVPTLKDLVLDLKVMQKNLNGVLTELVNSNSTIGDEAEETENLEEDDEDDDDKIMSNEPVTKKKKTEPD